MINSQATARAWGLRLPSVLPLACLAAAHGPGHPGLGEAVRAGWAARQAIVSEGREAGRA
ncbi:MAG TPA: hypothetical protein PLK88_07345 [Methanothrix sp.]|nr:hypothetical protein [Methanothrix sp.]HQJ80341.1 hypothetical protein [Methanothrix sp.]